MRRFSTRLSVSRGSRCCQTPQSRSASANKEISFNCPSDPNHAPKSLSCQFVGSQWARPRMQGTLRLIRTRSISVSKGIFQSGPLLKSENLEEYVLDFEKGCGLFWNCPNWIRIYLTGKQHLRLVTRTDNPVSSDRIQTASRNPPNRHRTPMHATNCEGKPYVSLLSFNRCLCVPVVMTHCVH